MKNYKDKQNQNASENQRQRVGKRVKRWWLIMLLIVVAVLVSGLVAATIRKNISPEASSGGTFTVRRDNLTITVTEGGSIRAKQSIDYKCKVKSGYRESTVLTILSIVPAGTYVTQEDVDNEMVLVQLDASTLEERLVQEEMELSGDTASLASSKEALEIQKIQNESDIAAGQLKIRFALLDLQKYLGAELAEKLIKDVNEVPNLTEHIASFLKEVENDPNLLDGSAAGEELKKLQDNIIIAEGKLRKAQDTLTGTIKLHDANYVSDLDLLTDRLTVQNSEFAKESAIVSRDLFKEYDFPKNAEQYLSDYIEAGRALERIGAQCRSKLAQAVSTLSKYQQNFDQQDKLVKDLTEQLEYCTIKAQAPGLVIYGTGSSDDHFRSMRSRGGGSSSSGIIAEGETVSEGQTIISMPDTAAMIAEIAVHETEVDKVGAGQRATIVMDAFPDSVLQGEVLEVAPLPDQQRGWMNPDLKVYKSLVGIDGTHDFLRSRMSCKVQILVEQLEDAIIVPIQVVSNRDGRKVCYVMTSKGHQERVVRTGLFNDTFVEIIEGLEVGEEVMLNPPLFSELGSPDSFGQQQPIPQSIARPGATDVNDTETQGQPSSQTSGGRTGPFGDEQSTRRGRPTEGGERPQGRQFELTDERINMIMSGLAKLDPEKAKELEQLRKSDPEKFKAELMKSMRDRMRQGRSGSGMRQGQGDAEGRRSR